LCVPGAGPFVASIARSACTKAASVVAAAIGSAIRSGFASSPSSHRAIDQGAGNASLGAPRASVSGIGSGSCGARIGSQRSSFSIWSLCAARSGIRTTIASPSR
jgi:hypothetical protein